jgi:CBS domain-containing protein/ribosome-associated translation inhibitor RaiA
MRRCRQHAEWPAVVTAARQVRTGVGTDTHSQYGKQLSIPERVYVKHVMDIADIVIREYVEVDAGKRLGKVRSIFERENPKGIVVTEDGEYAGVIGERQLVQSHIEDNTKASALTKSAPRVDRYEDIREVARVLVEGGVKIAPVYEGEKLYGVITEDAILDAVLENLDALTVEQIYTEDVVSIDDGDRVGRAINRLREHGISRLPVVDGDNLVGVVTTHDIVDFVVRDQKRQGKRDRAGDLDRMLDLPVYDLMSSPVLTANPDETVQTAVERMLAENVAGLIVTPEDDDSEVLGVVTKTDVLRALTFTEEEQMDVQITNIGLLDTITREEITNAITEVADKYSQMQVHHAHVRFHEHKEKLRGTPLIQAQIRLRTSHGQVAGSGEGYGAEHAFHVALDKLERNVLELKGVNADEKYQGQLLRKLGDL